MKRALILFGISLFFSACLKRESFPDEPRILSGRLDVAGSAATMVLSFTDGDGNFGLEEGDTSGLFSPCIRRWNLYAEYYKMQNGQWVFVPIDPCDDATPDPDVPFYYVVPWAKPTGQDQTQEGEISIDMPIWNLGSSDIGFDTVLFKVKIVDRDMNESNVVEVGPVVK
jgi:hypothetical protein